MKFKSHLIALLVGAVLILGFQNCSNSTDFSSVGQLVAKSGSADSDIETVLGDEPVPNVDEPINGGDGVPVSTPPPTSTYPDQVDNDDGDHGSPNDRDENNGNDGTHDDGANNDSPGGPSSPNSLNFVCVLEGPGHSIKVGFSEGALSGQVGTPRDVCMTENACLNIISTKFKVKAAKRVGFCSGKNPHVIPMSESQISAALAQADLIKEVELSRRLSK